MGNKINHVGKKYGLLTVIKEAPSRAHRTYWECICDCGKKTVAEGGHLKHGHTTSCGCRQGRYIHGLARTKTIGSTREYKLWSAARSNARRKGILCTITPYDIHIPEKCPIFGIKLDKDASFMSDNLPSLDRIDSAGGYTPDNIWVISWKANKIKSDSSVEELKMLTEKLEQKLIERKIHETRKS